MSSSSIPSLSSLALESVCLNLANRPEQFLGRMNNTINFSAWCKLKNEVPTPCKELIERVEETALTGPVETSVDLLFQRFLQKLTIRYSGFIAHQNNRMICCLQLHALEKRYQIENLALETCWNQSLLQKFHQQAAFQHVAPPNGVEEIRAWLNNPANAARIQEVRGLDLAYLSLKVLPSEIGLFIGLQRLDLSKNQLSSLPESFGNLTGLTFLSLSKNQLSSLPESFGNLTGLTFLSLSYNQLSSLPESFGNLTALANLGLSYNQLRSLPESFGNLTALANLGLSYNQLRSLPEFFGNLTALANLDLSYNQLRSLPESFGNLTALTRNVSLDHNQWMLVSDKKSNEIWNYATYLDKLEMLKKYTPQSPLGDLFHAIIFNKPTDTVQRIYARLSPQMQQRIADLVKQHAADLGSAQSTAASSSADPSPSQNNLFTDMGLFALSVQKATYALYESLEPEQKKFVHWHVLDLAGMPTGDDNNWSEHHVFDHVLRFTDALQRATQN